MNDIRRFSDLCARGQAQRRRVFIRGDLKVPQDSADRITEDTRIRASRDCIRMALQAGAAVMVTSHLGRPSEGQFRPADSLAPVAARLAQFLGHAVPLVSDWVEGVAVAPAQVVLLENCRLNVGEKENRQALARQLAALCDIYVNDAFGSAHRAEGTTHGIARFAPLACAGPLLAAEIDALTQALAQPRRPLVAIVAGAKVSTKLTILQSLADKVDQLIVGGGIANTFMLAAGLSIGKSLAEPDLQGAARSVMAALKARGAEVPIPTDVVVARRFAADAPATVKAAAAVAPDDMILDIGPDTPGNGNAPAPSSGTARSGCSSLPHSTAAPAPSPGRLPNRPHSALPAAATRSRPSPSTASPGKWATSRPAAGPFWRCSKAKSSRPWPSWSSAQRPPGKPQARRRRIDPRSRHRPAAAIPAAPDARRDAAAMAPRRAYPRWAGATSRPPILHVALLP